MDFSQEDLFDAIDRLVAGLLERAGVDAPPVDALRVAEDHLGIPVEYAEPEDEDDERPFRRRQTSGIVLAPYMTEEQQQTAAAHAIARTLLPDLLRKLDVTPGTESKQAAAHFRTLIASRLLVPTRMFRSAQRECKADVPALKDVFRTASTEMVAMRLLDLDQPCVMAIVDDGVVAVRRGNTAPATKKLTPAEQQCLDHVMRLDLPHRLRAEGWTVHGWPVPERPIRRVILRAVPDDI
jgi:predicted transcriptional regulator